MAEITGYKVEVRIHTHSMKRTIDTTRFSSTDRKRAEEKFKAEAIDATKKAVDYEGVEGTTNQILFIQMEGENEEIVLKDKSMTIVNFQY